MLKLLTAEKNLNDPILGSRSLNALGFWSARIRSAHALTALRTRLWWRDRSDIGRAVQRDGFAMVPDFLPLTEFKHLRDMALKVLDDVAARDPAPDRRASGFSPKTLYPWGFDRCEGGTLGRFVTLNRLTDDRDREIAATILGDPRLHEASLAILGRRVRHRHFWINRTCHGGTADAHDPQKDLHRDTFTPTVKFWLFLEDVRNENGPFMYVPGSHRLNETRYRWEMRRIEEALRHPRGSRASAFRVSPQERDALGLSAPKAFSVPANTLVIANTFGFHRRGDATPGASRLAIFGTNRPSPFLPL